MSEDCRARMELEATAEAIRFVRGEPLERSVPDSEYTIMESSDNQMFDKKFPYEEWPEHRAGDRGHHEFSDGIRRVVVFGGAGFLGNSLGDALSDAGHDVRTSTGSRRCTCGRISGRLSAISRPRGRRGGQRRLQLCRHRRHRRRECASGRDRPRQRAGQRDAARGRAPRPMLFVFASTLYVNSEMGGELDGTSKQAASSLVEAVPTGIRLAFHCPSLRFTVHAGHRLELDLLGAQAGAHGGAHRPRPRRRGGARVHPRAGCRAEQRRHLGARVRERKDCHHRRPGREGPRPADDDVREMLGNQVAIEDRQPGEGELHVAWHDHMTPYSYRPRIARRLTRSSYLDLGQGYCSSRLPASFRRRVGRPDGRQCALLPWCSTSTVLVLSLSRSRDTRSASCSPNIRISSTRIGQFHYDNAGMSRGQVHVDLCRAAALLSARRGDARARHPLPRAGRRRHAILSSSTRRRRTACRSRRTPRTSRAPSSRLAVAGAFRGGETARPD